MKKLTKASIIIVSTVFLILVLASCSKLNENPVKIVQHLDKEGYDSEVLIDPSDMDDVADETGIKERDIEWLIMTSPEAWNKSDESGILIYCISNSAAKKMVEDLEDYIDDNEDFEEEVERFTIERKGKYVFFGCEYVWESLQ